MYISMAPQFKKVLPRLSPKAIEDLIAYLSVASHLDNID